MLGCKLCFYLDLMFLLFQTVEGFQVVGQYYVSENRSTWMQAARQCSLATRDIDFPTLSADISSSLLMEDLWVGYYVNYTTFQYTGCMTTNGYSAKLLNTEVNINLCQSVCGDVTNIGINKTACFCFNTKPMRDIHQSGCLDTCGDGTVCGGEGYMSLYKDVKESEITMTTDDKGFCLKYEGNKKDQYFVWENCEKSFKTICSYDNGTVRLLDGNNRQWQESVQECLQTRGLPTSLNSSRSVVQDTGPAWTGIINGLAVYKVDEATFLKSSVKMFGFVKKNNENVRLQFSTSSQELLRGLCKLDMPVPTGNETLSNDITKRKDMPVPTGNKTLGNDITDRKDMPVPTGNETIGNDIKRKGLIVGITVPSVIVVTISVVVLVVLIRRGKVPHIYKRRGRTGFKYDNTNTSVSDIRTSRAHINQAFEPFDETVQKEHVACGQETQKDDSCYAHDYFILEKDITCSGNRTYYSTVNRHSGAESENVKPDNTNDSGVTYDLTSYRRLNKEQEVNDKYDTLENAITKSPYKSDDNTYSHTKGMQEVKNIKTDNIYGIQTQNVGLTDTGNQDAYNHLNSKLVVKPDQIYDIPEQ